MNPDVKSRDAQRADEWFDIVDANDRAIGRAMRGEVHARGLWHRAVHVLVFDAAGRVFLQKRSIFKDSSPGCWDSSCSGHLDAGEDYDAAAIRELGEEIGLVVSQTPTRWLRLAPCEATGWEFVWVYRLQSEGPFVLHPAEIERGEWREFSALAHSIRETPSAYTSSFRLIWAELAREQGS